MGDDSSDSQGSGPIREGSGEEERVATFIRNGDPSQVASESTSSSAEKTSERRQTTLYLDADVKRKLKAYCSLEEVEMSTFVNDLVADELEDWSPDL